MKHLYKVSFAISNRKIINKLTAVSILSFPKLRA